MKSVIRSFLVWLLTILVANVPAQASTGSVLGYVARSRNATANGINIPEGTNVYAGDLLSTTVGGTAWIELKGGRILLHENSGIRWLVGGDIGAVELDRGTVDLKLAPGTSFRLHSGDVDFTASGSEGVRASVSSAANDVFVVQSFKGHLAATVDGKTYPIPEGKAVWVKIREGPDQDTIPARKKKRKVAVLLILGAAMVGGATAIGLILNDDERKSVVSPSVP